MNPNTDQRSMRVYASNNTQYKTEPNEEQSRNGVVPLDSLPAAWWNWLWNEITSNNNNALLSITDLRTEIGNVLINAGITASDQVTNQLAQAIIIIHQRKPFFDDQHNPVPGSVISSAARSSVSVDGSTGQMTVNALSDWASQDSVKTVIDRIVNGSSGSIASLEQDINDLDQKTGTLADHVDSNAQAISDEATARQNADGTLTNLTTAAKSNLVAAINEVNDKASPLQYSTSEFDTKKKWADGKKIYGRVLTDLRIRFSQNTSFPTTYNVEAFAIFNNTLYVCAYAPGVYMSTDGSTFTRNTSFPTACAAISVAVFNNTLYVGADSHGVYTSTDGSTFTQNTSFPTTYTTLSFAVFNNTLYVGTYKHGVYTSTNGSTFTQNTSFPTTYTTVSFVVFNNTLYVGTYNHGVYTSTDGSTFTQNTTLPTTYTTVSFVVFNNTLYVGTYNHGVYTSQGIYSNITLSNISRLLFTQLRNDAGPLGLKSVYIDSSNHLVGESDGTPTEAIIEYTKTT